MLFEKCQPFCPSLSLNLKAVIQCEFFTPFFLIPQCHCTYYVFECCISCMSFYIFGKPKMKSTIRVIIIIIMNPIQGWGQIRFIKYKYKYKYIFSGVSNTNTNTNTLAKIWSNTNTNTAHQIQIQIQIHNEAETKLPPFYRKHIQIHCIVRRLFYLFKFHWKLSPKVQSTISLHWFR